MTKKVYYDTMLYHKDTNLIMNLAGFKVINAGKVFEVKH